MNHNKSISCGAPASPGRETERKNEYEDDGKSVLRDIQSQTETAPSLNDTERKTRRAYNQDFAEWPRNNQSHRRRERAGISDGNKRLSKKISGERRVIKMERADFKLKEVTSRIGPASYMEVYRSTNDDAKLLYKGKRVKAHDEIEDFDSLGVKFIETIDKPRLGMRIWVY